MPTWLLVTAIVFAGMVVWVVWEFHQAPEYPEDYDSPRFARELIAADSQSQENDIAIRQRINAAQQARRGGVA